jgi:hypothetical protein
MGLEAVPALGESERRALTHALEGAGVRLDGAPEPYRSAWRRTAAHEAVDNEPAPVRYARSPRRTRGATRA